MKELHVICEDCKNEFQVQNKEVRYEPIFDKDGEVQWLAAYCYCGNCDTERKVRIINEQG